jgi:hypothetical protein
VYSSACEFKFTDASLSAWTPPPYVNAGASSVTVNFVACMA